MSTTAFSDRLRFLRALASNPREIGAVAPSSSGLSRAVAAQIDPARSGPILELGPGTGALTRGILARGIVPERLTAIEYDPALAEMIAVNFPGVRVIRGDAFELGKALGDDFSEPFAAVVSGIPLLNFPPERRRVLLDAIFEKLAPGAPFIQFSYGIRPPILPTREIAVHRAALVWMNIPPARVWVYRQR